ncbi:hypothetical protein C2E23DRAFT_884543 [Lenzites betulinus]|nr:hypothetical protein C2E23DRAFT_884543 [Lenzites betulinus]
MSVSLNVPIGQPYQLPLYLRIASDAFGDANVRHVLINVYLVDEGATPGHARAQCLVLKQERGHVMRANEGIAASYPHRPGTQVFLPKDLFDAPLYTVLSRIHGNGDPFVQVIRLSFSINLGVDEAAAGVVTLRTRTDVFEGLSWELCVASIQNTSTPITTTTVEDDSGDEYEQHTANDMRFEG